MSAGAKASENSAAAIEQAEAWLREAGWELKEEGDEDVSIEARKGRERVFITIMYQDNSGTAWKSYLYKFKHLTAKPGRRIFAYCGPFFGVAHRQYLVDEMRTDAPFYGVELYHFDWLKTLK